MIIPSRSLLTVPGISEKVVPVASYDIDDFQEYTSSLRSRRLGEAHPVQGLMYMH